MITETDNAIEMKKSVFSDDREGYELQITIQIRQLYVTNFFNLDINQIITVYAVPISHYDILNQRQDEPPLATLNAIITLPNSVLSLYHDVIDTADCSFDNNNRNVNISLSARSNRTGSSISTEQQLSLNTSPAHIMVHSSQLMTEVSVLDYQSSNSDLTIYERQNRNNSIDIHAGNTSFDRSVQGTLEQRENHNHISTHGHIDVSVLAPKELSILENFSPLDSREIQGQQSPENETKSKHTSNSNNVRVGNKNVRKTNRSSREQFHVLDFSRRKHLIRSTINNIDALDCRAQSSNQQNIPPDEALSDVDISQVGTNTTMNERCNDLPSAASELLAIGYNRNQIDRALEKFYQNRGHNNPTLEELRYIVVVENSETDDESK
ncbi:uncharacterized protein [Mytilus edulis]|uniref:uncharacterized protein isoform X1 n=2 Tax=Mytilus edulis TaxID=6550 RepID=UPI0039EEA5CF